MGYGQPARSLVPGDASTDTVNVWTPHGKCNLPGRADACPLRGVLYCRPMLKAILEKSRHPVFATLTAFGHFGGKDWRRAG